MPARMLVLLIVSWTASEGDKKARGPVELYDAPRCSMVFILESPKA